MRSWSPLHGGENGGGCVGLNNRLRSDSTLSVDLASRTCVYHHDRFFFLFSFYEKQIIVPTDDAKLLEQFFIRVNCMFFGALHAPTITTK
jgi:hypothetical protein